MAKYTYILGVLVAETIYHGDGTGTRTTYRPDGTVDTMAVDIGPIPT